MNPNLDLTLEFRREQHQRYLSHIRKRWLARIGAVQAAGLFSYIVGKQIVQLTFGQLGLVITIGLLFLWGLWGAWHMFNRH